MSTFWLLLFSYVGCLMAGVFIARNPERVKGWMTDLIDKMKRRG